VPTDLDNPFLRLAERYEAEHAAVADPASVREELESDWRLWVPRVLPRYFPYGFAPHHAEFWEWLWAIERLGRPQPRVSIWSRGGAKSTTAEGALVALGSRRKRRYALYVSMTQDQADKHVASIAGMLESDEVAAHYPEMTKPLVGKFGNSKGWRRNRLRTASGFTVDALGLDSASRGARVDEMRPDVIVIDDIDDPLDTPAAVKKKVELLTKSVLPLGTPNVAVISIQNLIHDQSVFAQLAGVASAKADFLADRIVSGPIPAVEGLEWVERDGAYRIAAGRPTWEGQDLTACQHMIDTYGLSAFLSECQHETTPPAGGMFDHLVYKRIPWSQIPRLLRTTVWVDPAVTDKDTSDSQGIQADGLGVDGKVYRLYSWEQRTSPQDAIRRALRKAVELEAITLGVETDQGGDTWYSVVDEAKRALRDDPENPCDAYGVQFISDKAGAGHGPKTHRASLMLADYERGGIVHVEGTHTVLERALHRFPKLKPFDLVDCSYWSWADLRGGTNVTSYRDKRAPNR
jgi:hypothetical protein